MALRRSGVLMHITSLPGPYGIGTMGKEAFAFVDFLEHSGQRCWQILPLNPTGFGNSPYQSCSAYAGNPYLIDLPLLMEEGLLTKEEASSFSWSDREDQVNFGLMYQNKRQALEIAYSRFSADSQYTLFCQENSRWLPDFALYIALKSSHGGKPWYCWEDSLKRRDPDRIWQQRTLLKREIDFQCFVQFLFYRQWNNLLTYAHSKDIQIIGDVPIYVPYDSADVWCSPELFQLDDALSPLRVAGCPPDAFTEDGQLWGNPLYRWDVMAENGFQWWIRRLEAAGKLYDMVRMDHFRGFEAYWSVPAGDKTAKNGKWIPGPGLKFLTAIQQALPKLQLIAEDLGYLTPEVLQMRDDCGLPGMKVLGFAFDARDNSAYLPHNYTRNSVCYTGTHDNMTTRQWFDTADADAVAYASEYMCLTRQEGFTWGVIRTALSCVSDLCIIPMQDLLDLGQEARMNFPGTIENNWTWRLNALPADSVLEQRLYRLTKLYGRADA